VGDPVVHSPVRRDALSHDPTRGSWLRTSPASDSDPSGALLPLIACAAISGPGASGLSRSDGVPGGQPACRWGRSSTAWLPRRGGVAAPARDGPDVDRQLWAPSVAGSAPTERGGADHQRCGDRGRGGIGAQEHANPSSALIAWQRVRACGDLPSARRRVRDHAGGSSAPTRGQVAQDRMVRELPRKWADSAHLRSRMTPYAASASDSNPSGAPLLINRLRRDGGPCASGQSGVFRRPGGVCPPAYRHGG
jgi:hypothetical protein